MVMKTEVVMVMVEGLDKGLCEWWLGTGKHWGQLKTDGAASNAAGPDKSHQLLFHCFEWMSNHQIKFWYPPKDQNNAMKAILGFFKPAKAGGLVDGILLFRHGRHHIVTLPAIDNLPVRHREPEKLFDLW